MVKGLNDRYYEQYFCKNKNDMDRLAKKHGPQQKPYSLKKHIWLYIE